MQYRRAYHAGACYFFTVVTHQRQPWLTHPNALQALRHAIHHVRRHHPFTIDAFVLLPEHLHCLWTLPPNDDDFSLRWNLIKRAVTLSLRPQWGQNPLWQKRFWEHLIRDEKDFLHHYDYIHYNPVKHGLVQSARDWPHSSIHRFVEQKIYPPNWGSHTLEIPPHIGKE